MKEIKNKIEAILFTTGRFMNVEEIAKLCGVGSIGIVRDALKELIEDYAKKDSSLEILEEVGRFKLNIRKKYGYLTTNLLNDAELDRPTQETLSIIAYKQPILQCDIIKIRGTSAYDHIKILKDEEFITSERYGRSRLLKLAPKFFDYFDVVEDQLQSKFKEVEDKLAQTEEVQKKLKGEQEKKAQEPAQDEVGIEEAKEEVHEEAVAEVPVEAVEEVREEAKEEAKPEEEAAKHERKKRKSKGDRAAESAIEQAMIALAQQRPPKEDDTEKQQPMDEDGDPMQEQETKTPEGSISFE
ncbi:MAG: SMC-Scp complex subunit ScpB [Candidatus Woesearchaeota archaeon]